MLRKHEILIYRSTIDDYILRVAAAGFSEFAVLRRSGYPPPFIAYDGLDLICRLAKQSSTKSDNNLIVKFPVLGDKKLPFQFNHVDNSHIKIPVDYQEYRMGPRQLVSFTYRLK